MTRKRSDFVKFSKMLNTPEQVEARRAKARVTEDYHTKLRAHKLQLAKDKISKLK